MENEDQVEMLVGENLSGKAKKKATKMTKAKTKATNKENDAAKGGPGSWLPLDHDSPRYVLQFWPLYFNSLLTL